MPDVDLLAVVAATVAAFVSAGIYYAVLGARLAAAGGVALRLALWAGFPFVLWVGAIVHERTPWRLAVIHAGDWLVKLLLVSVIVSVWQ
jgi:Protein of unknown function (DUF1761)